jgi:RhoGEF domain
LIAGADFIIVIKHAPKRWFHHLIDGMKMMLNMLLCGGGGAHHGIKDSVDNFKSVDFRFKANYYMIRHVKISVEPLNSSSNGYVVQLQATHELQNRLDTSENPLLFSSSSVTNPTHFTFWTESKDIQENLVGSIEAIRSNLTGDPSPKPTLQSIIARREVFSPFSSPSNITARTLSDDGEIFPIFSERASSVLINPSFDGSISPSLSNLYRGGVASRLEVINSLCELQVQMENSDETYEPYIHILHVIRELIETELDFSRDINVLIHVYKKPMLEETFLSQAEADVIFGNIESIYNLSVELLEKFKQVSCENTSDSSLEDNVYRVITSVCTTFLSISPYFLLYSEYCSTYKSSITLLQSFMEKPIVKTFLCYLSMKPELNGLDLPSFLIKPLQRLCKYPLFLREMQKSLRGNRNPDLVLLVNRSIDSVEKAAHEVNDNIKRIEKQAFAFSLWTKIEGLPPSVSLHVGRNFVSRLPNCTISFPQRVSSIWNENVSTAAAVYLFSDMLLVLSTESENRESLDEDESSALLLSTESFVSRTSRSNGRMQIFSFLNKVSRPRFLAMIELEHIKLRDSIQEDVVSLIWSRPCATKGSSSEYVRFTFTSKENRDLGLHLIKDEINRFLSSRLSKPHTSVKQRRWRRRYELSL